MGWQRIYSDILDGVKNSIVNNSSVLNSMLNSTMFIDSQVHGIDEDRVASYCLPPMKLVNI